MFVISYYSGLSLYLLEHLIVIMQGHLSGMQYNISERV